MHEGGNNHQCLKEFSVITDSVILELDKENHSQNREIHPSPTTGSVPLQQTAQTGNLSVNQESDAPQQNTQTEILPATQASLALQHSVAAQHSTQAAVLAESSEPTLLSEQKDENEANKKKSLDEETRKALGQDPENKQKKELALHIELVALWATWISAGLSKETKEDLLDKYPRKGNLLLEAPELNPEIAVILNESGAKRDSLFIQEQNYAASGMSALGEAITMILNDEEETIDRLKLLQNLGDAGKLLAQLHYQISSARKAYIAPVLTKQTKELLQKTSPSTLLYGNNLSDIIKTARSTEKLGKDLKYQAPVASTSGTRKKTPQQTASRSLNFRGFFPRPGTSYQSQRGGHQKSKFSTGLRYSNNQSSNNAFSQNKGPARQGGGGGGGNTN